MEPLTDLETVLRKLASDRVHVVPLDLQAVPAVVLDLTRENGALRDVYLPGVLGSYVEHEVRSSGAAVAIGRYAEDRAIYRSALFAGQGEPRTVHLGMDLFLPAGTTVMAALEGIVHSFADNRSSGDYGPTVILEHAMAARAFYTLYGHLSRGSLRRLRTGQRVGAGEGIGALGAEHENGGWPPHLHFQVIDEMGGRRGDFPGVACRSELERFVRRCPDPNWLLGIPACGANRGPMRQQGTRDPRNPR